MKISIGLALVMGLLCVGTSARAQDGCAVWSHAENRCLQAAPAIVAQPPLASTAAMLGTPVVPTPPNTFTPTADAIFVCVARSVKALDTAVDLEHGGVLTSQFAALKLRGDATLRTAQAADVASCDKGSYIGAMEQALNAEAVESKRLQGLLTASGVVTPEPTTATGRLTAAQLAEANQTLFNLQQSRRTLKASVGAAEATYASACRTLHEQVNQTCSGLRRAIDVEGALALRTNATAIVAAARLLEIDPTQALQ